jgi:ATP-dependent helicase/nuclease subunit B
VLKVPPLDRLGAPADARWRGTRVHDLLDRWWKGGGDPAALDAAIADLAQDPALGAVEAAGWLARVGPALRWVADQIAANSALGREPLGSEIKGEWTVGGVTITAKADRIDRDADGLIVVDYKSGDPPKVADLVEGRAVQLGLLSAMIDAGAFPDLPRIDSNAAEYWLLKPDAKKTVGGYVEAPYKPKGKVKTHQELVQFARVGLFELTRAYLTGTTPFKPGEKTRGDYDHLARRDEWIGRSLRGPLP